MPSSTLGKIAKLDDQDWFSFEALAGEHYLLETRLGSLSDTILILYDTDGTTPLDFNDDIDFSNNKLASSIEWKAPLAGTYFAQVTAFGTETGSYRLKISNVIVPEPTTLSLLFASIAFFAVRRVG